MCIPLRNAAGYIDLTAHKALTNIERENRIVYICSPYRGNVNFNVKRARYYCRFAVNRGFVPLAPHIYFPQFMSEETEREKAFAMNFELLNICREMWVFGKITEGMAREIDMAKRQRMKIRYFTEDAICK